MKTLVFYHRYTFSLLVSFVSLLILISCNGGGSEGPKTYQVSFDTDGGGTINSQTIEENQTVSNPSKPLKTGFVFVEWLDVDTNDSFSFSTKISKNTALKAKWEAVSVVVEFDSRGGSDVQAQTVSQGSSATSPTPTRLGYDFVAWHDRPGLEFSNSNVYDFQGGVQENITLYAEWGGANIVNIEDEVFRNHLINEIPEAFQGDKIDKLSPKVLEIKQLNLKGAFNSKISSLSGIEYFTELEILSFEQNKVSSIDLSQNTKLVTLNCEGNQLKSLDLSSNEALVNLNCSSNRINSMDISNCLELRILNCQVNQLITGKFPLNKKLEEFSCSGNNMVDVLITSPELITFESSNQDQLEVIDIRSSSKLKTIKLIVGGFSLPNLTTITLSREVLCNEEIKTLVGTASSPLEIKSVDGNGAISSYTENNYSNQCP